ncbi:MAG: hypothetical protein EU530_00525 [Promethearchaeota archaeon]|nr:MAG: hypothetical protein EU530_00525 [Candidatus Lokiarchaeota archaeon]
MEAETFFHFEKQGQLIEFPKGMPKPGPYYPCLVKMNKIKDFPFEYALYFSTDHHLGKGGIWLYLCNGIPSESKNWKSYDQAVIDGNFNYLKDKPTQNPIYIDRKQGLGHMETPYVNIIDNKVYLTYHKNFLRSFGRNQPTLLSTSDDGINFQRINGARDSIILRSKLRNSHTGYFRWAVNPFHRIKHKFIGYSLFHGGKYFQTAMWGSYDAIHWDILQIFNAIEGLGMQEDDKILNWHTVDPNSIRRIGEDQYVIICDASTRAWGNKVRCTELYEIFVAGDGKTITRPSQKILSVGNKNSFDCEEVATPTTIQKGNTIYLIYVGTSHKAQLNTLMTAIGAFSKNDEK